MFKLFDCIFKNVESGYSNAGTVTTFKGKIIAGGFAVKFIKEQGESTFRFRFTRDEIVEQCNNDQAHTVDLVIEQVDKRDGTKRQYLLRVCDLKEKLD